MKRIAWQEGDHTCDVPLDIAWRRRSNPNQLSNVGDVEVVEIPQM